MQTYDEVAKRKDRAIATLLSFKETECDRYLPRETSIRLRKLILDQINDLVLAATIPSRVEPEFILNELFIERLESIEKQVSILVDRA